jgi:hypothetical protein
MGSIKGLLRRGHFKVLLCLMQSDLTIIVVLACKRAAAAIGAKSDGWAGMAPASCDLFFTV